MKNLSYLVHFALVFSSCQIFSQTKLISYKSHSGDMKYFEKKVLWKTVTIPIILILELHRKDL